MRRFLRKCKSNTEGMLETIAWLTALNTKHRDKEPLKSYRMRIGLFHLQKALASFLVTINHELNGDEEI